MKAGGARERREAERLVVAARAVGVDLARAPRAVLAEEEIDAREDRVVSACARRGGEVHGALGKAVESALGEIVVGARGDGADDAHDLLGRAHGAQVQRAGKDQRVEIDPPRTRDVRVPHQVAADTSSRRSDGSESGSDGPIVRTSTWSMVHLRPLAIAR